jgi:hypothetical protein
VSDKRTNPSGRISAGGAKKAERRRAPGAARHSCRQAKPCPREKGRKEELHVIVMKWGPPIGTTRAKISWNHHKTGIAGVVRTL